MKCRIYLFANDLIYDDVVSEQRHLGLENLIGAIFIPSEEYEFGFGFFPRLTYNLQKSAYTDKWDKLKQFLSTAKKDKENKRLKILPREIKLFKVYNGQLTLSNIEGNLAKNLVVQLDFKKVKTPLKVFVQLPRVKKTLENHFKDSDALRYAKSDEHLALKAADRKAFVERLYESPSFRKEKIMADHIVLQQIAGRKDTVDRINALIDALGITKKASATLSHGVLHVKMAQAKDTMDAIAKGVLPEKVKTYYDKVLKADARLSTAAKQSIMAIDTIVNLALQLLSKADRTVAENELIRAGYSAAVKIKAPFREGVDGVEQKGDALMKDAFGSQLSMSTDKSLRIVIAKITGANINDTTTQFKATVAEYLQKAKESNDPMEKRKIPVIESYIDKINEESNPYAFSAVNKGFFEKSANGKETKKEKAKETKTMKKAPVRLGTE